MSELFKSNKILLTLAAIGEVLFGLVLLLHPPIIAKLIFAIQITGIEIIFCRILGISLLAFGLACWPEKDLENNISKLYVMFIYSLCIAIYLGYQGTHGQWIGTFLWPVVILHSLLTLLFGWQIYTLRFKIPKRPH